MSKTSNWRILLVRPRLIGDVVLTTPAIRAVREKYPSAHIAYLVEPLSAPVVQRNPHLNEVIVAAAPDAPRRLWRDLRLAVELRRKRFDLAIDFHGGPRSSMLTWASHAPIRIGYRVPGRSWMYTTAVPRPRVLRARHSVDNQWDLLEPLGIARPTAATHPTEVPGSPEAERAVERWLRDWGITSADRLVVLHAGARVRFRRWPPEHFAEAIVAIGRAEPRARFVVLAGPGEDTAARIVDMARERLGAATSTVIDPQTMPLDHLQALAARAAVFIGSDSGPLHLAGTTGVPIVGLYGPTLPATWAPWRPPDRVTIPLEVEGLPCRPCDQRVCAPGDFRCLTALAPERVVEAAIRCLKDDR